MPESANITPVASSHRARYPLSGIPLANSSVSFPEPEDHREEDEQQQAAEDRGDAEVRRWADEARDRRAPRMAGSGSRPAEGDPIEQRIQRQQDQVVDHDRCDEPLQHVGHLAGALEPAHHRGPGDREARQQREQVQRDLRRSVVGSAPAGSFGHRAERHV